MGAFDFNKREYDHFVEYCGFTDEETVVLAYRRRGLSIVEISDAMHRSEATTNRTIKRVKNKIMREIRRG